MSSKRKLRERIREAREQGEYDALVAVAKHIRTVDELEHALDGWPMTAEVRALVKARIQTAAPHLRVM